MKTKIVGLTMVKIRSSFPFLIFDWFAILLPSLMLEQAGLVQLSHDGIDRNQKYEIDYRVK